MRDCYGNFASWSKADTNSDAHTDTYTESDAATSTSAESNADTHATCNFTVSVLYNFAGFFSPVTSLPSLNAVNAGRAIPIKFSLSGNKGLNIFAAWPASGAVACSSNSEIELTDTVTAGNSSLNYDSGADQYIYVWKTESSWAGTCRQFVFQLNDDTIHRANFRFK